MNRFFRNKTIAVKVLKDEQLNGALPEDPERNIFEGVEIAAAYSEVAKDFVTHAALVVGGVFAACKIIERICR